MKQFLLAFSFLSVFSSNSQVTVKHPEYYYVSKWLMRELQELPVGTKILFRQNCTTKLPSDVPTGTVFFENVFHDKERFSMAIEFKDTVVKSVTYYLNSKQKDLLKIIGYSNVNAIEAKGQWTYVLNQENHHSVIVGDKKRIIVVQTL